MADTHTTAKPAVKSTHKEVSADVLVTEDALHLPPVVYSNRETTTEKYTLDALNLMVPAELESVRESGDEERRQLSDSVTSLIELPVGWRVNAEYRGEFGGQFPVQLRYTPDSDNHYFLCLCSPGEMLPAWVLLLLARDGSLIRILHQSGALMPAKIAGLLAQIAGMHRFNCTATTIAELMHAEVVS